MKLQTNTKQSTVNNKIRRLTRHLKKNNYYGNDKQAMEALAKLTKV